jgi:HEAT repeat protein
MDRLLRLRPGERVVVVPAVAASALSAAGLTVAASTIDALLFARRGVGVLPVLYLVLGATMFFVSVGVAALLGRLGRGRAFVAIPIAIGAIALAARVAVAADVGWIYPVLWLLRGAAEFLLGMAVWGLSGIVTDTQQAKRFFPLIGGAAVLGQVVGGLATDPLAAWLGTENLILVWAGTLTVVVLLGRRLVTVAGPAAARRRRRAGPALADLGEGLRGIRRSSLLRWMTAGSVLFSLLFFSLYLPFSRAAAERYARPEELAGFLGLFFAVSTGVTLALSLVVMNRLLGRVGVPTVMMVLPVLYLVAFGVLTIASSFALLVLFRFLQVVWLQGGASTAWEAAINTVPADRRDRTRAFLYGGPTQVGTVLAGVVALVGEGAVSPRTLAAIGFVVAIAAVVTMARVRRAYAAELVVALREGRPNVFGTGPGAGEPFGLARADRAAVEVVAAGLDDPDPGVRRVAAELLGDLDPAETLPALERAVADDDPDVRATALRSLVRAGAAGAADIVPERLEDPAAEVRLAALDALAALRADWSRARPLLHDEEPLVRARAASVLLERGGDDTEAKETFAALARSPDAVVRAAAYRALPRSRAAGSFEAARTGLDDPASTVRAEAARALAALDAAAAAAPLFDALEDRPDDVLDALGDVIASLDGDARARVRSFAAERVRRAVESAGLAEAVAAAGADRDDGGPIPLLRDSLRARAERYAITAVRAVSLLGHGHELSVAIESLSSPDPAQRANAIEVIETVGEHEVVRPLLALWEPGRVGRPDPGWREALLRDDDPWIRACAAWALGGADRTAGRAASGAAGDTPWTMGEALATVPLLERVVVLRSVPLFAGLPPQDLKPIAAIATERRYEDADTIAEQGDPGDEMHIIVEGYVMVILREPGGHRRVLAVRSAGDVIGEMAVLTSAPRMASLAARGTVRLLTIERRAFESMLRERPETSLALLRVLCQRLADREAAPPAGAPI